MSIFRSPTITTQLVDGDTQEPATTPAPAHVRQGWRGWWVAFLRVLPAYIAIHLVFFVLTYLVNLFLLGNFSTQALPLHSILHLWDRWDTGQFTSIATNGYVSSWQAAFFPLFPLLERGLGYLVGGPFIAGLIISNLAMLALLLVLYRLVQEEAGEGQAKRTILYLSIFPTAFFLMLAYNESLFILCAALCLYQLRHGNWLLAGLAGLFASLTRSAGVLLVVPFLYEYLRQRDFQLRAIRVGVLAGGLIPLGLVAFMIYTYKKFHDALAFSHAQAVWKRSLQLPWKGFTHSAEVVLARHVLSFDSIHSVIDLSAGLFMLVLVVLCFVGPWRFKREQSVYALYAAMMYLFLILFPSTGTFPFQSLSRLVIELFPVFIVLGAIGKRENFNLYYTLLSLSIFSLLLLQFMAGGWIV